MLVPMSPKTLVLIPAHNEQDCIAKCIEAVKAQTRRPDYVVVVVDNCIDDTMEIAQYAGVDVFLTRGNTDKKAGALNQALKHYLPRMGAEDYVVVTDADCTLDSDFLENSVRYASQSKYGAVGGVFRGDQGGGFVGHLQRNEYARYARDVARLKGKCLVVTGTAAVFRVGTLRALSMARRTGLLPSGNGAGGIYDTTVLTEDNEISFALQHLGFKIISPVSCGLTTEVMLSWRDLWKQRLRWKRGAVENCVQYGLTRVTAKYWARQLLSMAGVLVTFIYFLTIIAAVVLNTFSLQPLWLGVAGVFVVERAVTIRSRGWKQMLLSLTMYELVLDYFLQACHAKAYADAAFRRRKAW